MGDDPAATMFNLAVDLASEGRHEDAVKIYGEALECYQHDGNPIGVARTFGNLARSHRALNDIQSAIECSDRALQIFMAEGDRLGEAMELLALANTVAQANATDDAAKLHMKSLRIGEELGHEVLVAMNLFRLGLLMRQSEPEAARRFLRHAFLLYVRNDRPELAGDAALQLTAHATSGLVPSSDWEDLLDGLAGTPPTGPAIRALFDRMKILSHPRAVDFVIAYAKDEMRVRCVGAAYQEYAELVGRERARRGL